MGMRQRLGSIASNAKRRARSNARFDRALAISRRGGTKAEACEATGMTMDGLNSLLKRKGYGKGWPMVEDLD